MANEANGGHTSDERRTQAFAVLGGRRTAGRVVYNGKEIRVGMTSTGMLSPKKPIPGISIICPFDVETVG